MHSSKLRGQDFQIRLAGEEISHHDFFAGMKTTHRLGIVSPHALDGLGATAFILASVTAFYDAIRAEAARLDMPSFRTYPEFYSLQLRAPHAVYSMLDIWPGHKDVPVSGVDPALAHAVIDRSVHTLLLPAAALASSQANTRMEPGLGTGTDPASQSMPESASEVEPYDEVHMASLRRTIRQAYLFDATGETADADLLVSCPTDPVGSWVAKVASTVQATPTLQWPDPSQTPTVTQSLRRIETDEAIRRLATLEHPE